MKNIFEVFKQKESEYNSLVSEYRRMSEKVNGLARELDAIRLTIKLLGDAQDQGAEVSGKLLSQPQMVRVVLMERGAEMHLSDILKAVEKKFNKKLSPNVTAAVIYRYAKRGSLFYKAKAPNTWGLLESRANPTPLAFIDGGAIAS
jgi:hypothetical protein